MLEDVRVEAWNVDRGEDRKCADNNGKEEEPIAIDVLKEWEFRSFTTCRVKAEHAATDTLEFPSGD